MKRKIETIIDRENDNVETNVDEGTEYIDVIVAISQLMLILKKSNFDIDEIIEAVKSVIEDMEINEPDVTMLN